MFGLSSCQYFEAKYVDTAPHGEVSKWPTYRSKLGPYELTYKIPSSDEFPVYPGGIKNSSDNTYIVDFEQRATIFRHIMDKPFT